MNRFLFMLSLLLACTACGTVGGAVVRLLDAHRADLERRAGGPLDVVRVAVRDASRDRGITPSLQIGRAHV